MQNQKPDIYQQSMQSALHDAVLCFSLQLIMSI